MKESKVMVRILGIVLVFLMIGTVLGGLPGIVNATVGENSNSISEDPFNYQGKYVLDTQKLTAKEKTALSYVQKYAIDYAISPALIMGVIKHESNFNPNAIGNGGLAIGYMQLHWDAAYDAGYRSARGKTKDNAREDWPTDGLEPDTNIKYGCGYLKICYDKHKGSPVYGDALKNAISAYNLGWPHGPDKSNENSYVNLVLRNYEDYKSKYANERKIELKLGWNMISIPFDTTLNPADIKCDVYKDHIYWYNPTIRGYVIANTLQPGKGYWIYAKEDCTFTVSDTSYKFNTPLKAEWNMIGSETNSLPLDNLKGCNVWPDVYWYNPTIKNYDKVSTIEPGKGHWVWVPEDCTLTTKRNGGSTDSYAKVVSSPVRTGAKFMEITQPPPPPPPMDSTPPTTTDDYDGLWHNTDFTITLTATDDLSGVAETYYKINNGPTKSVSSDGQPYITTESASNTLEYWSVDNAGNAELPHKILTGIRLDKTTPTGSITIAGEDQTLNVGKTITFDAGDSSDNVDIVSHEWDFGDETTGLGITTPHTYTTPGTYTVALTVKDAAGNTATDSITITVLPAEGPPMWIVGVTVLAIALGTAIATTILWKRRR